MVAVVIALGTYTIINSISTQFSYRVLYWRGQTVGSHREWKRDGSARRGVNTAGGRGPFPNVSIYVVVVGAYTVLSGSGHHVLLPLQMIMTNLLMPVLMSAALLLLIRFIRDSFTRQQTRIAIREARKKKGTKSTASVSPATDFKESSMATNGGSTTTDV